MRLWMAFLAVLPACGSCDDSDVPATTYGTIVKVTFADASKVPLTSLTWDKDDDIDTDTSGMCDKNNDHSVDYCVIAGTSITLANGAKLRAHGGKPLVLLATSPTPKLTGTINIEGTIDVSSTHDGSRGAGAAAAASLAMLCSNTAVATGNSGGFGGSFGGKGGNGGPVDGTMGTAAPALTTFPTDLRGGCPGGDGSSTFAGITPTGGLGGGAVAIIADEILMNGKINASGAGGKGGPMTKSGGGGGGSGGMIVLDARSVVPGAGPIWLFANGGGGGQGGTGTGTGAGAGDDGNESMTPTTAASGGNNGNSSGGSGGSGSAGTAKKDGADAGDPSNSGGGGGGGGGAGLIRTPAIAGAIIAPLATPP